MASNSLWMAAMGVRSTRPPAASVGRLHGALTRHCASCCLLESPGPPHDQQSSCPIKEASWDLFARLRADARCDPFFGGCEAYVARHLYSWQPDELVSLSHAFSRGGGSNQVLRRLLWGVDRWVPELKANRLVQLLEVFAACGLREHDPKRPDLFHVATPQLTRMASRLSAAEVGRVATIYRQLNLREEALFEALGARLASICKRKEMGEEPHRKEREACRSDVRHEERARTRTSAVATRASDGRRKQKRHAAAGSPVVVATMSFLTACGRLNLAPSHTARLFELVGPAVRSTGDVAHLTALVQLAAKLGLAGCVSEVEAIWCAVHARFEASGQLQAGRTSTRGFASQVVYGQLLLALVFDETYSASRDRALTTAVAAVCATFSSALSALDERLARQLQVAELACRLERPAALHALTDRGLLPFLEDVSRLEHSVMPLTKGSSQQHLQVSGVLQDLGVRHSLEEKLSPYVADVRVRGGPQLIEIDGPLHFVGASNRYDLKSMLKHRLLTKQGWQVHHIAWNDWPVKYHSRLNYVSKLLRSPAPGRTLHEYQALERSASVASSAALPPSTASSEMDVHVPSP